MERIMKKQELIAELAARTNFYKCNMKIVVDALEDIIIEHFNTAELGKNSELYLAPGLVLVGTRKPACEVVDPRTGEIVMGSERVVPSALFKQSLKQKLYKKSSYYKVKRKKG